MKRHTAGSAGGVGGRYAPNARSEQVAIAEPLKLNATPTDSRSASPRRTSSDEQTNKAKNGTYKERLEVVKDPEAGAEALSAVIHSGDKSRETVWDKHEHTRVVAAAGGVGMEVGTGSYYRVKRLEDLRRYIPSNQSVTPEMNRKIIATGHSDLVQAVAGGRYTDRQTVSELADHEDESVKHSLSYRRDLEPTVVAKLATDDSERVALRVLNNYEIPDSAHTAVARHPSDEVRRRFARKTNNTEAWKILARDPVRSVRRRPRRRLKKIGYQC